MATGRIPLSAERISAKARELIDEIGLDALSMRRLGRALGYEAMAIYKHVPDKQALLDLVVSDLYSDMSVPDAAAAWDDRLRHIACELRAMALASPHMFVRAITRPPGTPAVTKHVENTLAALRDSGLNETQVIASFWLFVNTTSGALLAETTALSGDAPVGNFDGVDPQECKALAQFGSALADCDFAMIYDQGIETLMTTIAPEASPR